MIAVAQSAWAGQIMGIVDSTGSFTSQSGAFSVAAASPNGTTLQTLGSALGPNVIYTTLTGTATDFGPTVRAAVELNVSVGAGSSVSGVRSEAWSGAVRLTNSGETQLSYRWVQSLFYSLETTGEGTESLSMLAYLERFDSGTNEWIAIGATSLGIGNDTKNSACSPACTGSSSYTLPAQSFLDVRLRTRLQGSLSQPAGSPGSAVPEPGTVGLLGLGLLLGGVLRRR